MAVATGGSAGNSGGSLPALNSSLRLVDLDKVYPGRGRRFGRSEPVVALRRVSLEIPPASTLAVVGVSGSGKSTLGRCAALLETPTSGKIFWGERELTALTGPELRQARRAIQMIFQDPVAALEPRFTLVEAVAEPLEILGQRQDERQRQALARMQEVGLGAELAARRIGELSGGQQQRALIARALAAEPRVLVVDEGLSALDLSTRAQVANLLLDLQQRHQLAILLISHDLRWVPHLADRVVVLDRGEIVESTAPSELLRRPRSAAGAALVAALGPGSEVDDEARGEK